MTHSKKVSRILRIVERQCFLNKKATALSDKIKPRLDRINVRFNRPIARLQTKVQLLQIERDEKLGKVRGGDRVLRLREDAKRLDHEIKVRRAALNGGESAALQAALTQRVRRDTEIEVSS